MYISTELTSDEKKNTFTNKKRNTDKCLTGEAVPIVLLSNRCVVGFFLSTSPMSLEISKNK